MTTLPLTTRTLGTNGFDVSEVGLGCWQIGGDWGDTPDETAFDILNAARGAGVTFLDTADVYGGGRSERLIGAFLRSVEGPRPRIATKFGRGDVYPDGYSKDAMRRGIEGSLERLGLDQLDLVQLHCIPTDVLRQGDVFDWLRGFRDEGLIAHFGASVETVEEGQIAMQQEGLLSLQVIFNLFRQKLVTDLLPDAQRKGIGIIVRLPLASGLLSGKFTADTVFADTDHRNFNRDGAAFNVGETFAGIPFETGVALVDGLKDSLPEGLSFADMANRWILDHPAVSTIIPGASAPGQVVRNARASGLPPLGDGYHAMLSTYYHDSVKQHIRGPY
jgi:aryl-alcohol dehydrogenase-like predicted oxidoreductase